MSSLKEEFRVQYVMGLGEYMCYISQKDKRAKLVFDVWARSINGKIPSSAWQYTEEFNRLRNATSFKRDGFKFFSMCHMFLFDCLYLVSKLQSSLFQDAYTFLKQHLGIISRHRLNDIYNNWQSPQQIDVPIELLNHRINDEKFHEQPLKKVLVVATMTAGKSTLINALVGYPINKVATSVCTSEIHYIYNKYIDDGIILKKKDESIHYKNDITIEDNEEFEEAALRFNSQLSNLNICFIDTPGVNFARLSQHKEYTYSAINSNQYEAILFVANSNYFESNDEFDLLKFVLSHSKKPIIFVMNKVDTFNPSNDSIEKAIQKYEEILKLLHRKNKVIPISAEAAYFSKVNPKKLKKFDAFMRRNYIAKFSNEYYDLPFYYTGVKSKGNFAERTGIKLLETSLKNILQ